MTASICLAVYDLGKYFFSVSWLSVTELYRGFFSSEMRTPYRSCLLRQADGTGSDDGPTGLHTLSHNYNITMLAQFQGTGRTIQRNRKDHSIGTKCFHHCANISCQALLNILPNWSTLNKTRILSGYESRQYKPSIVLMWTANSGGRH